MPDCTCPRGMAAGVRLYGVQMLPQEVRLDDDPDCPIHDQPVHRDDIAGVGGQHTDTPEATDADN